MTEATGCTVRANLSGTWVGGFLAVAGGEYEAGIDGSMWPVVVQRGWYRPLSKGHPRSSADWELVAPWSPEMEAAYAAIPQTAGDEWAAGVRRFKETCRLDKPCGAPNGCVDEGWYRRHEYAEKVCSKCGHDFCWSCCGGTNVHEGGKHTPDYQYCPSCGHDWYQS